MTCKHAWILHDTFLPRKLKKKKKKSESEREMTHTFSFCQFVFKELH